MLPGGTENPETPFLNHTDMQRYFMDMRPCGTENPETPFPNLTDMQRYFMDMLPSGTENPETPFPNLTDMQHDIMNMRPCSTVNPETPFPSLTDMQRYFAGLVIEFVFERGVRNFGISQRFVLLFGHRLPLLSLFSFDGLEMENFTLPCDCGDWSISRGT